MEKIKAFIKEWGYVVLLSLVGLLVLVWFKGNYILDTLDFTFPYDRLMFFRRLFSIWDTSNTFGVVDTRIQANIIPYGLYYYLTYLLHISLSTSQKIITFFILSGGGLSSYFLNRRIGANKLGAFIGALIYLFNPFSLIFIWPMRSLFILSYAFFPLVIAQFIKIFKEKFSPKLIIIHAVTIFCLLTPTFSNPSILLMYLFLILGFSFFFLKRENIWQTFKKIICLGIGLVLLNFFWLLPISIFFTSELNQTQVTLNQNFNDLSNIQTNSKHIVDAFRLQGFWAVQGSYRGDRYFPWTDILNNKIAILVSFLPIIWLAVILLKKKGRNSIYLYFVSVILFCLFFLTGTKAILPSLKQFIFEHSSLITTLIRSLETKFSPLLLLALAAGVAYGIKFHIGFKNNRNFIVTTLILFISYLGIIGSAAFTGEVIYGGGVIYPSTRVSVPSEYAELNEFIHSSSSAFRLLPLPISTFSLAAYDWKGHGFSGATPDRYLLSNEAITSFKSPGFPLIVQAGSIFLDPKAASSRIVSTIHALGRFNIKYLVLHSDTNWNFIKDNKFWMPFNEASIGRLKDLNATTTKNFNDLSLVTIPDQFSRERIFSVIDAYQSSSSTAENLNSYLFLQNSSSSQYSLLSPPHRDQTSIDLPLPRFEAVSLLDPNFSVSFAKQNELINIYRNTPELAWLSYRFNKQNFSLEMVASSTVLVNGVAPIESLKSDAPFFSTYLSPAATYYVAFKNELSRLKSEAHLIGRANDISEVSVKAIKRNLIVNPSFESGSWQEKVSDCENKDANPSLAMSLNYAEKTNGQKSIQLEAKRHTACVSTKISIPEVGEYALSFDYQSTNAKFAQYYLQFDDEKKTVIQEKLPISTTTWQTITRKVQIPNGAKNARLYIYANATDGNININNRYDNFVFGSLSAVKVISIPYQNYFEKLPSVAKEGVNTLQYKDARFSFANQFSNGSFENGLWQEKVNDCNAKDDNGLVSMRADTSEKTNGNQSIALEATRHIACTSIQVPVTSGGTYKLSFDYQSPNSKRAGYYISFNNLTKTTISEDLPITSTAWQTFSKTIVVPEDSKSFTIYIYAKEIDGAIAVLNRYDNFQLIQIPTALDTFYVASEPTTTLIEPKSITFDLINPTKKQVHIKGATTPFFLGMSESYHDQWQLQVRNSKVEGWLNGWWPLAKPDRVGDAFHYKLDGFLNAWYVDTEELCGKQAECVKNADGSYDLEMTIEFWPQRWFYLGLLISGTTLAGCLGYLAFDGVRILRRKRKAKQTTV